MVERNTGQVCPNSSIFWQQSEQQFACLHGINTQVSVVVQGIQYNGSPLLEYHRSHLHLQSYLRMHLEQRFFKADLGVNFALRSFGVTPRFCSAAATAVLSYTTIRVDRGRCSVELHQGRAELHQGLNLKKS